MVQFQGLYQVCPTEVTQQTHLEFSGHIPDVYNTYSWTTGYSWTFHVPINIQHLLNIIDKEEYHAHYAFQQCFKYTATTLLINLPADGETVGDRHEQVWHHP